MGIEMKEEIYLVIDGSEKSGLGHISRISSLVEENQGEFDFKIIVLDDISKKASNFFSRALINLDSSNVESYLLDVDILRYLVFDINRIEVNRIAMHLKIKHGVAIKIAALDYFDESINLDLVFNLFDQKEKSFNTSGKNVRVGLRYAIINPRIRVVKNSSQLYKYKVLIRTTSKIPISYLKIIENKINIHSANNLFVMDKISEISREDYIQKLIVSEFFFGGGATCLLESIYCGVTVIFFPSNMSELNFAHALSNISNKVYLINVEKYSDLEFKIFLDGLLDREPDKFTEEALIDGLGASRIIKELISIE